jgi:drug/metabolite transporter (DMT)-like permease
MLIAAMLLAPFAIRDFRKSRKRLKDIFVFFRLALLGAFPAQVLMTIGTQFSTASNAAILTLSLPVISMIFAFLILGERMNSVRWISFFVAVGGVVLCAAGDIQHANFGAKYLIGNALIFISIVANAYYNIGCKEVAGNYTEMEMVFYTYLVVVILLIPFIIHYEPDVLSKMPHFTARTWTGLLLLTFFHNFLSMLLFFKALKNLDAVQVALSNYLITFFGLPVAAIFLHETLGPGLVLGGMLVLISTIIVTIVDYRWSKKQS